MADRTGAFLSQVYGFLEQDFTGEMILQCQGGRVLEMAVKQRIKIAEDGTARSYVTLLNTSGLTAAAGRP